MPVINRESAIVMMHYSKGVTLPNEKGKKKHAAETPSFVQLSPAGLKEWGAGPPHTQSQPYLFIQFVEQLSSDKGAYM